jgi:hypothetical protein
MTVTTGRVELLEDGPRCRCLRAARLAPVYYAARMEQRADRLDPASGGLNDCTTSGERADASVRCEGNFKLCAADEPRHGAVTGAMDRYF